MEEKDKTQVQEQAQPQAQEQKIDKNAEYQEKQKKLYREESLDRLSSPDDLDRYLKTVRPSVWVLLISILVFLVGVLAWAKLATVEVKSNVGCVVQDGVAETYIKEADIKKISNDSVLRIDDKEYASESVTGPEQADEVEDNYALHASGIESGAWYYVVRCKVDIPDGNYSGVYVFEKVSPIKFITN